MNALLQETSSWTDTVDLALCLFIYEVCNDYQFDFLPGSDFVNFLNLKPASRAVTVRPKENLRVCYMVFSVSQTIKPRERGKLWAEEFLKRCGISKSYYDKHRSDVCGKGATRENQNYRKAIDKAIENAKRLNRTPQPPAASPYDIKTTDRSHALYRSYTTVWRIFFFMHFPHLSHIGSLQVKLNFASETEEKKRLTNSIFRFPERTRNN